MDEISKRDRVHLPECSVYACKKNSALCHVFLNLEARPEVFPGTRTHSSDRTMDLGLAEDHFSRPVVSTPYVFLICNPVKIIYHFQFNCLYCKM